MKWKLMTLFTLFTLAIFTMSACSDEPLMAPDGFVFVQGGPFVNTTSNLYGSDVIVEDFFIGIHQVTQREWIEVMSDNPSRFIEDDHPVENVSWYDAILFANRRSELVGLEPFYTIDKDNEDPNNFSSDDEIRWTVGINEGANGYRLPTEVEWEYAAGGGQKSKSFTFSGSNDPDEVAWYFRNSGDEYLTGFWHRSALDGNDASTNPVGEKLANELGIYDMSGNVREWNWNWYGNELNPTQGFARVIRGGGWVGDEETARTYIRRYMEPHFRFPDLGIRLVRSR